MKKLLIILFLFVQYTLSAQYFEGLIANTSLDSSDIKDLLYLAEKYSIENPYKAISFAEKALKLSKKQKFLYGEAKANSVLANNYNILGNYMLAIYHNTESINIYSKLGDAQNKANAYKKAGSIFSSEALLDEAKLEFAKALDIYFSLNDRKNIAKTTENIKTIWELQQIGLDNNIKYYIKKLAHHSINTDTSSYKIYGYAGSVLFYLGNYDRAILFFKKGIELATKSNDYNIIPRYLSYLGIIFREKEDYENSIMYFLSALDAYKINDKKIGVIISNYNLGQLYNITGDYQRSYNYYLRASNIAESINAVKIIPHLYICTGINSKEAGDYVKAEEYFLRSKEAAIKYGCSNCIAKAYLSLGDLKGSLNDNIQAEKYYVLSLEEAINAKNLKIEKEIRKKLGSLAASSGNYKKAYEYQQEFLALNDSIISIENKTLMANLEARYVLEAKENQINMLTKNNEITKLNEKNQKIVRLFLIAAIILVTIMLFLMLNRLLIIRKTNVLLKQQKIEIIQKNNELTKLNNDLEFQKKKKQYLNNELLQANINLRKSEERLIETNAAKDKFFSIISHDLRSPFATIVSFAKLLKKDLDKFSKEELNQMVEEFSTSVAQINNLLENLLQWSRTQTGKIKAKQEKLNLNDIIDDSLSLFSSIFKEKELIVNKQIDDIIMVIADRNMVDTILRNLISNAAKYSFTGQQISIIVNKQGRYAEIQVIDKGVGISKDNQEKLFHIETAQTTFGTNYEKGSGLGLLLCREFVERLGGSISVISEENIGSTFIFNLPLAD